ncbi:MAG: DUF58 domain-containing protein [Cyanobacteriota bacterium]|nr:DUF58 domain-containing protein [Cyanobacteriota bacterium]
MIPSRRVYSLLLLGIAIAIILAILFGVQVSIIATVLFDSVVLGLAIWDGQRVKANRVQVTRYPLQRLSIGRDNPVVLSVRSGNNVSKIRLRDSYPLEFEVSTPTLEALLEANSTQELTYTVHPDSRGEYQWGDIQVRQLGQWGLAWHDWKIPASQTVAVYPDLIGLRSLSIRLTLQNTGTMRQARRLGMGTEFAELREYGIGDDIRLIDWKATARRSAPSSSASLSRPLVRVLEPEREQTLIILLDRGRLMTAQVQGLKRFDWGLNATLSLALAGLNRGDKVGIGVFDREVTTWIPPERGQHQLSKLIERLTPIQPVLLEPDYVGAVTKLVNQQTRRALVVLITDLVDITASAELLAALVRLAPRYLPFCVTLRDPQVDRLANTPPIVEKEKQGAVEATYARAVALDLLAQRQVAFAQLKQKGVLVLDAPANQISEQLVDRYLLLKARNQL